MKKNYFYYIEEINQLNDLEKILYELIMFQESKQFYIYQEEAQKEDDSKIKNDKTISEKFGVPIEEVSLLKKCFIALKPELEKTIDAYLFDLKIATSFGLGIGSLIPSVMLFLEKLEINISYESGVLLAVGVILGVIYTKKNEIQKARKLFKKALLSIKNKKLNNTIKILKLLSQKLWIPTDKFLEYVAYTIMAIPMANSLVIFLKQNPNIASVEQALAGMGIGLLIHMFRKLPKLFNRFSKYFKMKKRVSK